jgi:hypothetical protein
MSNGKLIPARIGYFEIGGLGGVQDAIIKKQLSIESLLEFLCTPDIGSDAENILRRFQTISQNSPQLAIVPHEPSVLERFYWPLRNAKASFVLGNYLSTIALCGFVAEMVAIFLLEDAEQNESQGHSIDLKVQHLSKDQIGSMRQVERVKLLFKNRVISEEMKDAYTRVRKIRRQSLHYFSDAHKDLSRDAVEAFSNAANIVQMATVQTVQDGGLILAPALIRLLSREGIL